VDQRVDLWKRTRGECLPKYRKRFNSCFNDRFFFHFMSFSRVLCSLNYRIWSA